MSELEGCALVTGAARGIGAAIVRALAAAGRDVVINHASESSAQAAAELKAEVEEHYGVTALVVRADVSDFEEARRLVETAIECFGRIAVLVNNAGINRDGLLVRMKERDFDDVVATDLKGVFNMTRHAAKPLMKQRYGRIVNITSLSGVVGQAGQANYSAAKAGVIGLTKATARELAARDVTVNAVAPGFVATDMTARMKPEVLEQLVQNVPLKRMAAPADVADAVAFLASDKAGYITGQVLHIDGGLGM